MFQLIRLAALLRPPKRRRGKNDYWSSNDVRTEKTIAATDVGESVAMATPGANNGFPKERVGRAGWTVAIISLFALVALGGAVGAFPGIKLLRDQLFARGLITFLISISTVGLRFFSSTRRSTGSHPRTSASAAVAKSSRARWSVLGTIVGFYFGAAQGSTAAPEIAEMKLVDHQLVTHVTGGSPPYVYTLRVGEKDIEPVRQKVGRDGWIHAHGARRPRKEPVNLDVTDSLDHKASKQYTLKREAPAPASEKEAAPKATPR